MISDSNIRKISDLFCGNTEVEKEYYSYKTGPDLIRFFNHNFSHTDKYGEGFPSRWLYVYNKIVSLLNSNKFDVFLSIILSPEYIMRDLNISKSIAHEKQSEIIEYLNIQLESDNLEVKEVQGKYKLVKMSEGLELIGEGGFAKVFKDKQTGLVIKKLKEDYLSDVAIKSRFKREYNITKSLYDELGHGIINVYKFNDRECSYTMECAEQTYEEYINNEPSQEQRENLILQILYIMSDVHKQNIIHRDLSPNNIFIRNGQVIIGDFGLGKDLNIFHSHQTVHTNTIGQYFYCAPEQFMLLSDADFYSDVYSLGRIINFTLKKEPTSCNHRFQAISEKATSIEYSHRHENATLLYEDFLKLSKILKRKDYESAVKDKISDLVLDIEVESYIYSLCSEEFFTQLKSNIKFRKVLLDFAISSSDKSQFVIDNLNNIIKDAGTFNIKVKFEDYDYIGYLASEILQVKKEFVIKEQLCKIINYVAHCVNRFCMQNEIDKLIKNGVEPLLEDILNEKN